MKTKLTISQGDFIYSITKAKSHPLWQEYKIRQKSFNIITNAFNDIFVEVEYTTKSKSPKRNVDLFENLFNSFEGFKFPATIDCGDFSLES